MAQEFPDKMYRYAILLTEGNAVNQRQRPIMADYGITGDLFQK